MAVRRFHPKSETLQMGAVLLWVLGALAIRQGIGLDLASGGPVLAALLGLAAAGYLTSGKRVDVDPFRGRIRTSWRLAGLPLWAGETGMAIERVELRPEWMRLAGGHGVERRSVVYDLVLVGGGADSPEGGLTMALKEDQLLWRRAERKAREAARSLDLPVAVRWDRLFEDIARAERGRGQWERRFVYPRALGGWRRWT